jgi:hypothetical protein
VPSVSKNASDTAARAPTSNGVPLYRQGDPAWGGVTMGDDDTLSSAGCALTAVAMAMSKVTGTRIDPSQMDAQLDRTNGYSPGSDSIANWSLLGQAVEPKVPVTRCNDLSNSAIDAQLAAGKPVVFGVDYKGDSGTDHWMTITGKGSDAKGPFYSVNDPATGESLLMRPGPGGKLVADSSTTSRAYEASGDFVTFG